MERDREGVQVGKIMEQKSPRDIVSVARQICSLVPASFVGARVELDKFLRDCSYRAPELRESCSAWYELARILGENLPDPTLPTCPAWALQIKDVFAGEKTVEMHVPTITDTEFSPTHRIAMEKAAEQLSLYVRGHMSAPGCTCVLIHDSIWTDGCPAHDSSLRKEPQDAT